MVHPTSYPARRWDG